MKDWLQKLLVPPGQTQSSRKLPVKQGTGKLPTQPLKPLAGPPKAGLPNATIIYGIGASLMFVSAFFLLLQGRWFPALIVIALGACLVGFALHLLKHHE